MARGRCEIICRTIGITRLEQLVQIFDMFVSSVYRYSLGVWGPTAKHLKRIDNVFVDFIRRQYGLPSRTSANDILVNFGRRCAVCDARFLAAVQLARGLISGDTVWGTVLSTVINCNDISWLHAVKDHLIKMSILNVVIGTPAEFLSDRKKWGREFTRFCFKSHLNTVNGRSSDYFRVGRPFGIYPVIFNCPPKRVRGLFAFLLWCWRWTYNARGYPDYCSECDSLVNSYHLMFQCRRTEALCSDFRRRTGRIFTLEAVQSNGDDEAILSVVDGLVSFVLNINGGRVRN
jgi:hypothetical protein